MAMHSWARAWCWWWVWVGVGAGAIAAVESALSRSESPGGAEKKGPSRRLGRVREPERRQLGGL